MSYIKFDAPAAGWSPEPLFALVHARLPAARDQRCPQARQGKQTKLYAENCIFAKTGSGQTWEKLLKRNVFSQDIEKILLNPETLAINQVCAIENTAQHKAWVDHRADRLLLFEDGEFALS